jgi:ATP-dependent 26S proteasome regulatory subunit
MEERRIERERAQNLWASFTRSVEPLARAATIVPSPELTFDGIGGLAAAKEEILTYACAATNPELYARWGTFPPSGVLLIGAPGVGKRLLAQALANHTETSYVHVDVPRLVVDMIRGGPKVGELLQKWTQVLEEIPPLTMLFDELEFSQAHDLGGPRPDLPVGPIMDFLMELIDHSIEADRHLVLGSTGYPDTLRQAFARPGRLERVLEVTPVFPDDVVAALAIHSAMAEKRAGRPLFETVDWRRVVSRAHIGSTGDWVRILHAVLRRKARCEVGGESSTSPVTTADLEAEVSRFDQALRRIRADSGGNYV